MISVSYSFDKPFIADGVRYVDHDLAAILMEWETAELAILRDWLSERIAALEAAALGVH